MSNTSWGRDWAQISVGKFAQTFGFVSLEFSGFSGFVILGFSG
jgi:hypothetical protein